MRFLFSGSLIYGFTSNLQKKWKDIRSKFGREIPVVAAGGWGRGSSPLIEKTIAYYGKRLSAADKEWMQNSLSNALKPGEARITEADVIEIILKMEGVAVTAKEIKRMVMVLQILLENFQFSKNKVERAVKGKTNPAIAIVTRPDLL